MASYSVNLSNDNNGWDITVYWSCDHGDTSAWVTYEINQNSYGRTFQIVSRSNTSKRYGSGVSLSVGSEYCIYVYRNGTYNEQSDWFTITSPKAYTVSYNANGGYNAPGNQTKVEGEGLTLSYTEPKRTGYNFLGWGTNKSTVSYQPGDWYTSNANLTLYAIWAVKTFTLTKSQGTGTSLTISRTSSPLGGYSNGTLSNGATIAYNDVLKVTSSANTGYGSFSLKVGDTAISSGSSVTITSNTTISSSASVLSYTLSISAGTGSTISVSRTNSPKAGAATGALSNGARIYYSDTLKVTFSAKTGYSLSSHTVNDSSFTSGNTTTVTSNVSVSSSASVRTFTLSITQGAGTSLTVTRTESPIGGGALNTSLANGATLYYNDVLQFSVEAATGYNNPVLKLGATTVSSGSTATVTNNISVSSSSSVRSFLLTINAGAGSSITVNRTESPKGGADVGVLVDGDTIYYSDKLTITFGSDTGYNLATHTVNGSSFPSGSSYTATKAVTVASTASIKSFKLTIDAGTGSTINVVRTKSPLKGASTNESLASNSDIYYQDELTITFAAKTGYNLSTRTVNSKTFTSGNTHVVDSAVSVKTTATVKSFTLTLTPDAGSTITVNRTESPLASAFTGNVATGEKIYYNDKLTISFAAKSGYNLGDHKVNGSSFTSGASKIVTSNITVISTSSTLGFVLTLEVGVGSQIIVERTNSPKEGAELGVLSSGDLIYYSDELKITTDYLEGYNLTSTKVNESDFTSGGTHTVDSSVTVKTSTSVKSFELTISQYVGTSITVKRTSSPKKGATSGVLANKDTIYYSDVLEVTCTANTGYDLTKFTVNGYNHASGNSTTVKGAVVVYSEALVKSFRLSISSGVGTSITITRTSSPKQGASTGVLSNNATIYYSDVLKFNYTVQTGYLISTHTFNGLTLENNQSKGVSGNVSVITTATVKSFTISISKDQGSQVSVVRTSSPKQGASNGVLSNGDTIYYSDVLQITLATLTGWEFTAHTVNGVDWISGEKTVTSKVTVIATTKQMGLVYIDVDGVLEKYQAYIFRDRVNNVDNWDLYIPYVLSQITGSSGAEVFEWDLCS